MNKKIFILIFIISVMAVTTLTFLNIQDKSNNWSIDKNEYPQDEYRIDELPVSHKSAYEVRHFFEDSDTDNDGILKDKEIIDFDYKIKHSQLHLTVLTVIIRINLFYYKTFF